MIHNLHYIEYNSENVVKAAIINRFAKANSKSQFYVCSELVFSEAKKVADLVFCKRDIFYAYEVKALNDDIRRLDEQLTTYRKVFDYVYVVVTENHIKHLANIHHNIGIAHINKLGEISYKRKASLNRDVVLAELVASMPLSFLREQLEDGNITRTEVVAKDGKLVRKLYSAYLQRRSRWSKNDFLCMEKLHPEDIIRNTDYISLNDF